MKSLQACQVPEHGKPDDSPGANTETSTRVASSTGDATTRKRTREMDSDDLGYEEKKPKVAEAVIESSGDRFESALAEDSNSGDVHTDGSSAESDSVQDNSTDTRSISEDEERLEELITLGASALAEFESSGGVENIDEAIEHLKAAVLLIPDSDSEAERLSILSNLGYAHRTRFESLGQSYDLEKAIEYDAEAVSLTPDDHADKSGLVSNLADSYRTLFQHQGKLSDLEKSIEYGTEALSLAPKGHPERPLALNNLGNSYGSRFERFGQLTDLHAAIEYGAEAISLTHDGDPGKPLYLGSLGNLYRIRFEHLGELSDLKQAIKYGEEGVSSAPDGHPDKPSTFNNLGTSYASRFGRLGELPDLENAIKCKNKATEFTPDGHPDKPGYLSNLGNSYETRFDRLGELSDLGKAIECRATANKLTPDGHPHKPTILCNLGVAYQTRFGHLGELSDLKKSIECGEASALLDPDSLPNNPARLGNLGNAYRSRFERLNELSDLDKAIELETKAVSLAPDNHPDKLIYLSNLGNTYKMRFRRLGESSDLDQAIDCGRMAVSLTPDGHPMRHAVLSNLGSSYDAQFTCSGDISDLNKAIGCGEEAISLTPDGHPDKPTMLNDLGAWYATRFQSQGELSDLQSATASFRSAAQSPTGSPSNKFTACRQWAQISSSDPSSSPLQAYQRAMELLPQLVWIGTTLDRRYELIAEIGSFATEAASYAISIGNYDLALEWLEAGRSIVWGQIAQLRTPFDQLHAQHPKIADQLTNISRRLEYAGSRPSLTLSPESSSRNLDTEANRHVEMALDWDRLLVEARSLPGFEEFLCPLKATLLLRAAHSHPIAIINFYKSSCDALLLRPGSNAVSHIPLTQFSTESAVSARQYVISLVRDRKPGPRLNPRGSLERSLEELWLGVVKPVLDFLGYTSKLPVDQLPRLTWCTTGLLSFLPLHAARSHSQSPSGTFEFVISSYTPTLSALLSSQPVKLSASPRILAVGQEHTPGLASLPCTTKELEIVKKHTKADSYLQLKDEEATLERVLDAMEQFSWVHMACHGSQNPENPTQSAFHLYDGDLTLAKITKRSFVGKGLAFLSACQTATGDRTMPDEAVHLAAGMQMAGYPSVIGTMWSIDDEDGPEVADRVYAELLEDGKLMCRNSAKALHQAVAHLRSKVGEEALVRWAPFIHIGY